MKTVRLGAIDIGSSSVRLLISDVIEYNEEPYFKKDIMIRIPLKLGEDTFSEGYISDLKKEKLAILLSSFKGLLEVNDVDRWQVCATSAMREASNQTAIKDFVFNKTGIDIQIIETREEAKYILLNNLGISYDEDKALLFMDVGGGSTELVLFHEQKEVSNESFKLGTIRALEHEEEKSEWTRLRAWVEENCAPFQRVIMVGSGGNINKVNSLLRRRGRLKREELITFHNKLKKMTVADRVVNYNMNLNRAEEILPAIQIYLRVMKFAHSLVVETPMIGVADGMIRDLYMKRGHGDEHLTVELVKENKSHQY